MYVFKSTISEYWFVWIPILVWLLVTWRMRRFTTWSVVILFAVLAVLSGLKYYAMYGVVGPIYLD